MAATQRAEEIRLPLASRQGRSLRDGRCRIDPAAPTDLRHLAHAGRQVQLSAEQQHVCDGEQGAGAVDVLRQGRVPGLKAGRKGHRAPSHKRQRRPLCAKHECDTRRVHSAHLQHDGHAAPLIGYGLDPVGGFLANVRHLPGHHASAANDKSCWQRERRGGGGGRQGSSGGMGSMQGIGCSTTAAAGCVCGRRDARKTVKESLSLWPSGAPSLRHTSKGETQ